MHAEEVVGQKLLDLEGQKTQMMLEIEKVEQEVQRSLSKSQILESEQEYPSVLSIATTNYRFRYMTVTLIIIEQH